MVTYQLVNLDLGENPIARDFDVGPYHIRLVDDYDEIQSKLPQLAKIPFDQPGVDWIDAKAGEAIITATAECQDEPPSLFYSDDTPAIYDVQHILSYLLGRRVFLPEDSRQYWHVNHGFPVVPYREVPKAAGVAWLNRASFASEQDLLPLWYYLSMNDTSVMQVKLLLGCVSLELMQAISEREAGTQAPVPRGLESLRAQVLKTIHESDVPDDIKGDLKSAAGRWGRANAQQAFRNMLTNFGMIDDAIDGLPLRRVRFIFKMRNSVVHKGTIEAPDWLDDAGAQEGAKGFISARFIPALVAEYLNRKFGLAYFSTVQRNSAIIREYIYNGAHEGTPVEQLPMTR